MLAHVAREALALEIGDPEHQRHRLHEAVVATDLVVRARGRGDIAVAGRVDDHRRLDDERPRFRFEDHALWVRAARR